MLVRNLVKALFLSQAVAQTGAVDDFSEIKLDESRAQTVPLAHTGVQFIENSNKTVVLALERKKEAKDIIAHKLLHKHLRVGLDSRDINDEEEMRELDREKEAERDSTSNEDEIPSEFKEMPVHRQDLGKKFKDRGNIQDLALKNYDALNYYTQIFVGSQQEEVKVAFDTMSTVSLINSANCDGCDPKMYGFKY
mmetsp:Transcript_4168/g.7065  ORF Transcript_4168/g.7065 Transcript_4168/m.7065 type:complete len:194 (-) Transcript_4168:1436-2017(-)